MAQGRPGTDPYVIPIRIIISIRIWSEVADTLQIWEGITLPQKD